MEHVEEIALAWPELEEARAALVARGSAFAPVAREEIAGIDPVVERVEELARWLARAGELEAHGAALEPGVLFEGPPGTGKTLLARYLATASGARLVSVRDFPLAHRAPGGADVAALFRHARQALERDGRPLILFWDELDSLCETGYGAERPEAVSALLAELDGVRGRTPGLLLVACSNRPGDLDPALLRPGRLGLRIESRPPDAAGQRALLAYELDRYEHACGMEVDALAHFLSPADTAAAIREAVADAWRAAVAEALDEGRPPLLRRAELERALLDRLVGAPPAFLELSEPDRLRVAVHETGHALAALRLGAGLRLVTVRPGRSGLGQTLSEPLGPVATREQALRELRIGLGGIAAERIAGIGEGLGAEADTLHASELALRLADLHAAGRRSGALNLDATARRRRRRDPELSDALLARADLDAAELVERALADVTRILRRVGRGRILALARALAERETMTGPEFASHAGGAAGPRRRRLAWPRMRP